MITRLLNLPRERIGASVGTTPRTSNIFLNTSPQGHAWVAQSRSASRAVRCFWTRACRKSLLAESQGPRGGNCFSPFGLPRLLGAVKGGVSGWWR